LLITAGDGTSLHASLLRRPHPDPEVVRNVDPGRTLP